MKDKKNETPVVCLQHTFALTHTPVTTQSFPFLITIYFSVTN